MTTAVQASQVEQSYWKGAFLVAGTCIGGGMLALPIQTADAGFVVSSLILFAGWAFMTLTGLFLVEATLWYKNNSHLFSISKALLGNVGKSVSLIVYLFMNYASLVAYISGGATLINNWGHQFFQIEIGYNVSCIIFSLIFGSLVYLGTSLIGKINGLLVLVMGIFYLYLIGFNLFHLNPDNLHFRPAWIEGLGTFPLILAAFSYQMIVPSVCSYLNYDKKMLKKAILIGTTIPFTIYFLWILVIHGVIPFEGANGLHDALVNGRMVTEPLKKSFNNALFFLTIDGFAFLALVTSYLGLSLALFDFIQDVFKSKTKALNKTTITLLSLVPSLFLSIYFPNALLDFLDISGGFGDTVLSALIPISMVWVGRYQRNYLSEFQVFGGKWSLSFAASCAVAIFILQCKNLIS